MACVHAQSLSKSCLTLCGPMDCSPPGSSIHGISQARILEWVAISSPEDLPDPGIKPRFPTFQADALTSEPPGKLKRTGQQLSSEYREDRGR